MRYYKLLLLTMTFFPIATSFLHGIYNDHKPTYIIDWMMTMLTHNQRIFLATITAILIPISIVGNTATIYVNIKRRNRPLYQACLLSLAVSDILNTAFTGTSNMAQLTKPWTTNWSLGSPMCRIVPFVSVTAILASSMTLTGIALDRYWAIVYALRGHWQPGWIFSTVTIVCIWGLAAGVASPVIIAYSTREVMIVITDPNDHTIGIPPYLMKGDLCMNSEETTGAAYYCSVFAVIFVPLTGTFIWLYSNIAREIWIRRLPISSPTKSESNNSVTTTVAYDGTSKRLNDVRCSVGSDNVAIISVGQGKEQEGVVQSSANVLKKEKNVRTERKVRTFKVILLLMVVFFICRTPSWIWILIKFTNVTTKNFHWVMQYLFSTLTLLNSALNPFLYTFLNKTIKYGEIVNKYLKRVICFWKYQRTPTTPLVYEDSNPRPSVGSNMVPRGPCREDVQRKQTFYNNNIVQESNATPKMASGVYLGNGKIDENGPKPIE